MIPKLKLGIPKYKNDTGNYKVYKDNINKVKLRKDLNDISLNKDQSEMEIYKLPEMSHFKKHIKVIFARDIYGARDPG